MAKILGIDNMSDAQINAELQRGGKFVIYTYCISILVMSFKRSSDVYFVPAGQANAGPRVGYILVSLLLGWWGIPWGPIWTLESLFKNAWGGTNVTADVVANASSSAPIPQAPAR